MVIVAAKEHATPIRNVETWAVKRLVALAPTDSGSAVNVSHPGLHISLTYSRSPNTCGIGN